MDEFDAIIVGAGSAGCVLAARLGEDAARRILVLEAGGEDDHWLHPSAAWASARCGTIRAGTGTTPARPSPMSTTAASIHPRGKVVGGSSSINIMAYVRCHRLDYDRLPQLGLKGWSYADVLPYFRRAESFEGGGNAYRGASGPLKTRKNPAQDPVYDAFVAAAPELGYAANDDYNAAEQSGFGRLQHTIGNGRRCSAAVAYLRPALRRGNITLVTGAHATRILFDGPTRHRHRICEGRARHEAHADGDVILSGGAYNSPQLLMLSGIGPADELRERGIEPRVDLAGVGRNLWDHPMLATQWLRAGEGTFHRGLRLDRLIPSLAAGLFLRHRLRDALPGIGTAFYQSEPGLDAPDLQYFCGGGGFRAREWFPVLHPPAAPDVFGLTYCHLRPESRATVTLAASDPLAKPRILNNFLSTDYDRRAMREGLKFAIRAVEETQSLRRPRAEARAAAARGRRATPSSTRSSAPT